MVGFVLWLFLGVQIFKVVTGSDLFKCKLLKEKYISENYQRKCISYNIPMNTKRLCCVNNENKLIISEK